MSALTMAPYLRFEVRRTLRNPRAILFTALIPVMMYLLFSSGTPTGDDTPVSIHRAVLASMIAYGAIGGALLASGPPLAAERATGWLRQLAASPLPSSAAVIAKIGVCLTLAFAGATIVTLVGAATGAQLSVVKIVAIVPAMALGALSFGLLGLTIGALVKRPDSAQGATILSYLSLSALGGLWIPIDQMPSWMADIAQVLPTHHLLQIGRAILDGTAMPAGSIAALAAWTLAFAVTARWAWTRGSRVK